MKVFYVLFFLAMPLVTGSLFSFDAENGKRLYYEAKCNKCHIESDYTSDKRKVNDYAKLLWRVKRCDFSMGAGWFDEDIADVATYLNESFYKFSTDKVAAK